MGKQRAIRRFKDQLRYALETLEKTPTTGFSAPVETITIYNYGIRSRWTRRFKSRFQCKCGLLHEKPGFFGRAAVFICGSCQRVYKIVFDVEAQSSEEWTVVGDAVELKELPEDDPMLVPRARVNRVTLEVPEERDS